MQDVAPVESAFKQAQFKPGRSGNPHGRPKGARSNLREAFLADLYENWQTNGKETIEAVRVKRPHEYLKVVASLLPKELNIKVSELDELDDAELLRRIAGISDFLAVAGIRLTLGGTEAPVGASQTLTLSAISETDGVSQSRG